MNKYQKILPIISFIFIIFTVIYGNSQFQGYQERPGFFSHNGKSYPLVNTKKAIIANRIAQPTLTAIIISEVLGSIAIFFLLREKKEDLTKNRKVVK